MTREKIGTDEWVASYQQRLAGRIGIRGLVDSLNQRLPTWVWFVILAAIGLSIPMLTDNIYIIRIAGTTALIATVAIGLNVVVGYSGLLDLGFVAYYGIGAYAYAYLSSDFTGLHWPTWLSLILVTLLGALFGLLLGAPSLRLVGDYLAIVTLGFGQIFEQLTTSLTRVTLPGHDAPLNLTGGPNGILNLDPAHFLGFTAQTVVDYYYLILGLLIIILLIVYRMNHSRLGRAWRALREDNLAAELMGMPTRRLKLLAFSIGAAIAGLSGAVFAARQGSVFPGDFDITLLITLYAIAVLGGLGSLPGTVLGASVLIVVPEILRNPALAGLMFYIGLILILFLALRPRIQTPLLMIGVIAFGIVLRIALTALAPTAFLSFQPFSNLFDIRLLLTARSATTFAGMKATGAFVTDVIRRWLVIPQDFTLFGNWAFGVLMVMILLVTRLKQRQWRLIALIPTLYLLTFVWETRLSQEPSITRLLFTGVLLILLMIYRPNGLLGQKRVEIV